MKTPLIIAGLAVGALGLLAVVIGLWAMGLYNGASTLRNQYESKVRANEAVFDNMWKKISQSSQVTDAQKDAMKEVFVGYAQARSGTGGSSASFINAVREAVPQFDAATFRNLQNIITGSRDEWTANQVALVDISREYNLMLVKFPSNLILGMLGFQKIDPKIITSSRTEKAFATSKDDDVDLKARNRP